ncbi:hypothetical protein D3C87_2197250 [compost metagenome]
MSTTKVKAAGKSLKSTEINVETFKDRVQLGGLRICEPNLDRIIRHFALNDILYGFDLSRE